MQNQGEGGKRGTNVVRNREDKKEKHVRKKITKRWTKGRGNNKQYVNVKVENEGQREEGRRGNIEGRETTRKASMLERLQKDGQREEEKRKH